MVGSSSRRQKKKNHHGFEANSSEAAVAYKYSASLLFSSEFGLSQASNHGDQKTLTLHRFLEAVKFANGQKRNLKDPLFNPNVWLLLH